MAAAQSTPEPARGGPDGRPGTDHDGAEAVVRALLAHAGLVPQDGEVDAITAAYPQVQATAHGLYEVPGALDAVPAVTFEAGWDD
jgi:hypothetical protein